MIKLYDELDLIARICSISNDARTYVDAEKWRDNFTGEEITSRKLLEYVFSILIEDLHVIGVDFIDTTLAELCPSLYELDLVLRYAEVILPSPLYLLLNQDEDIKSMFKNFIENEYDEETPVLKFLDYLANENEKTMEKFEYVYQFLHDKLVSTPIFKLYAINILNLNKGILSIPVTEDDISAYLNDVTKTYGQLTDYASMISEVLSSDDFKLLINRISTYRNQMLNVDNINKWVFVFNYQNHDGLDDLEIAMLTKYTEEFINMSPLHSKYYLIRPDTITSADVASLLCGMMCSAKTKDDVVSMSDSIRDQLISGGKVLTSDLSVLWNKILTIFIKGLNG